MGWGCVCSNLLRLPEELLSDGIPAARDGSKYRVGFILLLFIFLVFFSDRQMSSSQYLYATVMKTLVINAIVACTDSASLLRPAK